MLINELPDDCLLTIFDYIQDLQDLINCFKVCEKWNNLIVARNKKVKYFMDRPKYSPDSVWQQSNEPIDVAFLSKWFPNLRILDFSHPFFENVPKEDIAKLIRDVLEEPIEGTLLAKLFPDFVLCQFAEYNVYPQSDEPVDITSLVEWFSNSRIANLSYPSHVKPPIEDIVELIRDSESLKGIICGDYLNFRLMPQKANLEMLSTGFINPNRIQINETMKQLNLFDTTLTEFKRVAHYFPNLERLKISNSKEPTDFYSDAPVLEHLKIVELAGSSLDNNYHTCCSSFLFMDSCPALQSAHIKIDCIHIFIDNSVKNANLQDLVIQYYKPTKWREPPMLISKYPNLKHLSLRNLWLRKKHIKQLILILPKLTLLDIRKSHGVTQEAADHVQDYCKQHGRSIKFYFKKDDKQIESDWLQSLNRPEKICRGFDFMEHCFFKSFNDLPHFLDPIDD